MNVTTRSGRWAAASERETIEAVADGDKDALRELYERHSRWLLLRLQRRCSDRHLVDEVLHDTFTKAWRRAHTYRGDGDVGAWLWRIAARSLIDRLRKRTPTPAGRFPRLGGPDETSAEDRVVNRLEHGPVGAALERLAPELRDVLQATVLDGLTTREAADLLGIPQGTVKTRAMRARTQLRRELA